MNWKINKIGLINFWLYDHEEFQFSEGRLLLRGTNGSGKSVTTQSIIPLLLDGNKSPERLDPFGTRARRIENYLLGDNDDRDESTGYLYMELTRGESGLITVGMGLRARRGKPLDFWGFCITDGRRIGVDFHLYKDLDVRIPLSRIELRNAISGGGEFYDTQKEYMAMVNRHIFGFSDLDDYDQLIRILIQLRSPKLSKDFKPTAIYEIMNNSLQTLSEEDLRPLSNAIEAMDNIQIQLDGLKSAKTAMDRMQNVYGKYNRFILSRKAGCYAEAYTGYTEGLKAVQNMNADIEDSRSKLIREEGLQAEYEAKTSRLTARLGDLSDNEIRKMTDELLSLEEQIKQQTQIMEDKRAVHQKKEQEWKNGSYKKKELQNRSDMIEAEIEKAISLLDELNEEILFYEHETFLEDIREKPDDEAAFFRTGEELSRYQEKIDAVLAALKEQNERERQYGKALEEQAAAQEEAEKARNDYAQAQDLEYQTRDEMIESLYGWSKENHELLLEPDELQRIARRISAYMGTDDKGEILDGIREKRELMQGALDKEINRLRFQYEQKNTSCREKEEELEQWQSKQEPEPERKEKTVSGRRLLEENNIAHIPFYRCVDFREGTDERLKGRIEEALSEMNLLDALVVAREDYPRAISLIKEGAGDNFIFPADLADTKPGKSLMEFLRTDGQCGALESQISKILESIAIDRSNSQNYLGDDGMYRMGLLQGIGSRNSRSRFIGRESRRRYKEEQINRLLEEIGLLQDEIETLDNALDDYNSRKEALDAEYKGFPSFYDLDAAIAQSKEFEYILNKKNSELEEKSGLAEAAGSFLKVARLKVRDLTAGMRLTATIEIYEQALEDVKEYTKTFNSLQNYSYRFVSCNGEINSMIRELDNLEQYMEEVMGDILRAEKQLKSCADRKEDIEEFLSRPESLRIAQEIKELKESLIELDKLRDDNIRSISTLIADIKHNTVRLEEMNEQLEQKKEKAELSRNYFGEELELGYCVSPEEAARHAEAYDMAKSLSGLLSPDEKSKSPEDYKSQLYDAYHKYGGQLAEYSAALDYLFDYGELGLDRRRYDITFKYNGKKINFNAMVKYLEMWIEEDENLLRQKDRELFEDILSNTLGSKLRARIAVSKDWVSKMNRLMEAMDTSMGLSFSLGWKAKSAESEGELDTKNIVDILNSDVELLTPGQRDAMVEHFRSKVRSYRLAAEENDWTRNYFEIMKDALDYRTWFEFKLSYTRTGEQKKELTDNAFSQFSGGEKAMAMYVPLFASVYSCYEGADSDCLRIISLDEAFAGVDDINISIMFKMLSSMRLNYIINSQVLWGCYETVDALSICELKRPNNADFVTIVRYHWNGKVREFDHGAIERQYKKQAV